MSTSSRARMLALGLPLLVGCVAAAVCFPALDNGFLNWDDPEVTLNRDYLGALDGEHLGRMLTGLRPGSYMPLAWLFLAVLHRVGGSAPAAFHLAGLLAHAAMAAAVTLLTLALLTAARPGGRSDERAWAVGAAGAGLLFALHPLQAEAVSVAAYLSDVPGCALAACSVLAYLAWTRRRMTAWLFAAWALHLLSCLWRWQGIVLPAVLLVLDVFPLRRLEPHPSRWLRPGQREVWLEKLPMMLVAAVFALVQAHAKAGAGFHPGLRLAPMCFGLDFFLWKWLVPQQFLPVYVVTPGSNPLGWTATQSVLFAAGWTALLVLFRRRCPACLSAWACYALALSPVLAQSLSGELYLHDRHAYLAGAAFAVLAGAGLARAASAASRRGAGPVLGLIGAVVLLLGGLAAMTRGQIRTWRDPETLWKRALSLEPNSVFGRLRLAETLLLTPGRAWEGLYYLRELCRDHRGPDCERVIADAHAQLGRLLAQEGRIPAAARNLSEASRWAKDPGPLRIELAALRARPSARGSGRPRAAAARALVR